MKKKLLFSMLLLLVGVGMKAQSVAEEQMDERFDNKEKKLPYGWFTEGWVVKDSVVQTEASSGSSFDLEQLMGGGNSKKENEPGGDPGEDPDDDPEEGNKNSFNIGDLLSSFMGGESKPNYLLTPPLMVKDGEKLVFKAKKGKKDNSGSGMSISLGAADSTFVVERSEYSKNQWERVADFTTELDTLYKEFTIDGTPAGEYRFRFRAAGSVMIDSVAGFHIDNEAPDIHIIENDVRAWHLDYSLCYQDSTRTLKVINTATGKLGVNIASENEDLFSLSTNNVEVEAADTVDVSITFNFAAGKAGRNETTISFTPTDERVWGKKLQAMAVVTQPEVWMEDFNTNVQPKGFFTEGWEFHDQVATCSSDMMSSMFGGGSTSFLMTPPLKVESTDEVLLFSAKSGSGDDGMAGLGAMFGGGNSSIIVEKSVYGSNKWEKIREFTEPLDSTYKVLWVSYIEPGEYRFRIIASDSIVVDSIAGFHIDNNAPDIYVLHNETAARAINYGMPQADKTETLAVVNTGTGMLQVAIASTDENTFGLSSQELAITASDTATVDVTYLFNQESLGIHQGAVVFSPLTQQLSPVTCPLTAYSTYADAWTEDFEPDFLREDETKPIEFPEGWVTTGWKDMIPSSGGGIMDMFSGMMGGGNDAPKTWMATTASDAYELITPRLQAHKGDVLRFEAELGSGMMAMMGALMGGGASGQLNVSYSLDGGENWVYYDTFTQSGYNYFVAPYSGIYQLRFTSPSASLDNFYGLRLPTQEIALFDGNDENNTEMLETYNGQTVNVTYDRILSATQQSDGTWIPKAYVVSLPYDYDFADYYEADIAKIYRLQFKEEYYQQFIFLPDAYQVGEDWKIPTLMQAGRAYLVVVQKGQINLSATDVTLQNQVIDDDQNVVYSFEDWYFKDELTPAGKWMANIRSISDVEADAMNIYGLRDDGTWARFQSEDGSEKAHLAAFRGYFEMAAPAEARNRKHAAPLPGTYRTLFQSTNQQGTSMGENESYYEMDYEGNIPFIDDVPTGIEPTIRAIDLDGATRYFDLQGRLLESRPVGKGIFIHGGQKVVII